MRRASGRVDGPELEDTRSRNPAPLSPRCSGTGFSSFAAWWRESSSESRLSAPLCSLQQRLDVCCASVPRNIQGCEALLRSGSAARSVGTYRHTAAHQPPAHPVRGGEVGQRVLEEKRDGRRMPTHRREVQHRVPKLGRERGRDGWEVSRLVADQRRLRPTPPTFVLAAAFAPAAISTRNTLTSPSYAAQSRAVVSSVWRMEDEASGGSG